MKSTFEYTISLFPVFLFPHLLVVGGLLGVGVEDGGDGLAVHDGDGEVGGGGHQLGLGGKSKVSDECNCC